MPSRTAETRLIAVLILMRVIYGWPAQICTHIWVNTSFSQLCVCSQYWLSFDITILFFIYFDLFSCKFMLHPLCTLCHTVKKSPHCIAGAVSFLYSYHFFFSSLLICYDCCCLLQSFSSSLCLCVSLISLLPTPHYHLPSPLFLSPCFFINSSLSHTHRDIATSSVSLPLLSPPSFFTCSDSRDILAPICLWWHLLEETVNLPDL